jgi:hypothetical protein
VAWLLKLSSLLIFLFLFLFILSFISDFWTHEAQPVWSSSFFNFFSHLLFYLQLRLLSWICVEVVMAWPVMIWRWVIEAVRWWMEWSARVLWICLGEDGRYGVVCIWWRQGMVAV